MTASRTKPQVSGNVSLKNILGSTTGPVVPAWKQSNSSMGDGTSSSGGGGSLANTAVVEEQGEAGEGPVSGDAIVTTTATATTQTKGRKERGKQKQTLFTIGSLVT